ncbi:hypothetical protein [Synechococcus sp. UW179A]|uniref:hypothetical protein n=1 Tax=Synechococcus sp. UW179A TaxID=2575510 RepID=UPI001FCB3D3B|nr:hypothetical protein [Synechococcus sp. UW179A]
MASIREQGLHEPIDLLEVDGQLLGFNDWHRVDVPERLGLSTSVLGSDKPALGT